MNTISVGGEGEVSAIHDIAVIDVSISKEAKTAKEATDSLNESIKSTLSYLSEKEIEKFEKSIFGNWNTNKIVVFFSGWAILFISWFFVLYFVAFGKYVQYSIITDSFTILGLG